MSELLVIVPTHKRAAMVKTLSDIWLEMDTQADIVFCVDEGDETPLKLPDDSRFFVMHGPPAQFVEWTNRAYARYDKYSFYGSMTDKHHPRTVGWEFKVMETLSQWDDLGFCYPNDGIFGEKIPTACFMTASVPSCLGWMAYPGVQHFCCDNIWSHLGLATGRIQYLPNVLIEMMHAGVKKSEYDFTQWRSDKLRDADLPIYEQYMKADFFMDVAKLERVKCPVPA